jgi:hypothetical protein
LKTLFKLAVALLVAHALFRFVPPYWNFTQFRWALKESAAQWRAHDDQAVTEEVLQLARQHQVPLSAEHVQVRREGDHLFVDVAYTDQIEFVPSMRRDWRFDASVDAWTLAGLKRP